MDKRTTPMFAALSADINPAQAEVAKLVYTWDGSQGNFEILDWTFSGPGPATPANMLEAVVARMRGSMALSEHRDEEFGNGPIEEWERE